MIIRFFITADKVVRFLQVSEEVQHLEVRLQEAQQHVSEPVKDEELK